MLPFLVVMWRSAVAVWDAFRDPRIRPLAVWVAVFLAMGASFYRTVEGWGWIDAFYFSVIALTTVGFGDLTPTTNLGRFFTIFYVLGGIGMLLAFVNAMVDRANARHHRGEYYQAPAGEHPPNPDEPADTSR